MPMRSTTTVTMLLLLALLQACDHNTSGGAPRDDNAQITNAAELEQPVVHHNPPGVSITTPTDWLVSWGDLGRLLQVANYPFDPFEPWCESSGALAPLPSDGTFIWLIEVKDPGRPNFRVSDFPPRATHFEFADNSYAHYEGSGCATSYRILFRDNGRFFQLHTAFGKGISVDAQQEALDVLDSITVEASEDP
jgi:hypothetical protein